MAKYQIQGVHNSKLPSHPQLPKVSVGPGVCTHRGSCDHDHIQLTSSQTAAADRSPAIEKDREINSIDETICVDVRESRLSRTPIADER